MTVSWAMAEDRGDALKALGIHEVTHRCPRCGSTEHGQPFAEGVRGLSLSHAGGFTLAVRADGPVGIDHEPLGASVPPDVAAHPSETGDPLMLWVRKEAILKAVGLGLQIDPRSFWIDESGRCGPIPGYAGPPVRVTDLSVEGFVAALASCE